MDIDEEVIETLTTLTAGKYTRTQIEEALRKADGDMDDALTVLQEAERPTSMFSEGVVSKRTKDNLDNQRANSKFGGIYSKKKRGGTGATNNQSKPAKLLKVEESIDRVDYFTQVLLLQNRETADQDLARLNERAPDGSALPTMQDKIEVAREVFEHSTPREYIISYQRFVKARDGGRKEQPLSSGGFGLVNLTERRNVGPPKINNQGQGRGRK